MNMHNIRFFGILDKITVGWMVRAARGVGVGHVKVIVSLILFILHLPYIF